MRLYFLRHGIAAERDEFDGPDEERPLTSDGRKDMEREAKRLAQLDIEPERVICSPLTRARETAEIVADRLDLHDRVVHDDRLAQSFDTKRLAEILREHSDADCLLLVGHEPDLSRTIGELTGGARVDLKKGGLARVDLADAASLRGELVWLIPPKLLYA